MISAVVLAAGRVQPMGETKLFVPLGDKPALQWVLESALAADLDEIICVARELESVRRQLSVTDERLFWLRNYAADRGQSTSVIAGLWAVDPMSDGVLFLLGDQPMIGKPLINALIETFLDSSALIVAPTFKEVPRDPVLIRRELFPELLKLKGDHGPSSLIENHKKQTKLVKWTDEMVFLDLDSHGDYERLKEQT